MKVIIINNCGDFKVFPIFRNIQIIQELKVLLNEEIEYDVDIEQFISNHTYLQEHNIVQIKKIELPFELISEYFSKSKADTISRNDLFYRNDTINVGLLKKYIKSNNVPDHAVIVSERIHDCYFSSHGWKTYNKIRDGSEVEYHPIWHPVTYEDEPDILFLDLHY